MMAPAVAVAGKATHLRRRMVEHVRTPLHRDGYALAMNSGFTAATGLFYWIVAARAYSAHAVGLNSALISSMMFLAGIASLNLPNVLVRFLPGSGERTLARVRASYLVSAVLAVCACVIFVLGVGAWAPRLGFLRSTGSLEAWFVFSTIAWCLFMIQDSVLTALGRAVWVPIENAVFSLLKLGLLGLLAALAPAYGIFVSWTIAMIVSVVGVNVILFARLLRRPPDLGRAAFVEVRDRAFARYFAADYVCSVAFISTANLMPVLVTAVAGATINAYYALAYAVVLPFFAFNQSISTSLTLHGTRDPESLPILARKAAVQGARVLIPSVVLLVALAPLLLSFFGPDYAHRSAGVLRVLVLGALPGFVVAIVLAVARVRRRLGHAVVAFSAEAVLALGLATPLLHAMGVIGAAVAWTGSQCVVAVALLVRFRRELWQ